VKQGDIPAVGLITSTKRKYRRHPKVSLYCGRPRSQRDQTIFKSFFDLFSSRTNMRQSVLHLLM